MIKFKNNQKGATAIILTLFIMAAMLFVGITANEIVSNGLKMARLNNDSTKAYFGAESGAEKVLWEVRKNNPYSDTGLPFGNADCCVVFDNITGGNDDQIINCNANCNEPIPANKIITLDNQSTFFIHHERSAGAPDTVSFQSVGSYKKTRRAVEITFEN